MVQCLAQEHLQIGQRPEAARSVMGAYFERMNEIAELHGGTVEKSIGDAVMVVFGVPLLHQDAWRAERIAALRHEIARAVAPMSR